MSVVPVAVIVATIVVVATGARTIHIVEDGDVEALLVFGETKTVLSPGIHIVPPFVSQTYPIDPTTMRIDTGDEQIEVPDALEADVREANQSNVWQ